MEIKPASKHYTTDVVLEPILYDFFREQQR